MLTTLRHFARQIIGTLLHLGFFILLTMTIIKFAFQSPALIKDTMRDANAYEKFVTSVADSNKSQLKVSDQDAASLRTIALNTFPPDVLEQDAEQVVDRFYDWLEGDSESLSFSVDLRPNRVAFAHSLGEMMMDRLAFLPLCEQQPDTIDPFTATCRPDNIDFSTQKDALAEQLLTNPDFLGGLEFNEKTVTVAGGRAIADQYAFAPSAYRLISDSPYILLVFLFVFGALYITVSRPRLTGLKWLAKDLCTSSATVLIAPIAYTYILPRYTSFFAPPNSAGGTQAIFNEVALTLTKKVDWITIQVAGLWFVTTGIFWLILKFAPDRNGYRDVPLQSSDAKKLSAAKKPIKRTEPPIQTSEGSDGKTTKTLQKKYKKIPKAVR